MIGETMITDAGYRDFQRQLIERNQIPTIEADLMLVMLRRIQARVLIADPVADLSAAYLSLKQAAAIDLHCADKPSIDALKRSVAELVEHLEKSL